MQRLSTFIIQCESSADFMERPTQTQQINTKLDRAVSTSTLDGETRELCLLLIREGSDAQAIRAIAILAALGNKILSFPASIQAGKWPTLPKTDRELHALFTITERDPALRKSFIDAITANPGPSERLRERLLSEYVKARFGAEELESIASVILELTERMESFGGQVKQARKRLLRFAAIALKKQKVSHHGPDSTVPSGILSLFQALGRLYSAPPRPEPNEASLLLGLLLDQTFHHESGWNFQKLQELWNSFPKTEALLRSGWSIPKSKKTERIKREQFAAAVIQFACSADTDEKRNLARSLLAITIPQEISVDQWLSDVRAQLALMERKGDGTNDLRMLVQAINEAALQVPVILSELQDIPARAIAEICRIVKVYSAEIHRLSREVNHLQNPDTIRSSAGDLIRDEIARQSDTFARLQAHVRDRKSKMARRLSQALEQARGGTPSNFFELENVIRDVIALLEERS